MDAELNVAVGSASQRKIEVVENVCWQYLPVTSITTRGFDVPSGQPDTPYDKQTLDGAIQRARLAKQASDKLTKTDLAIGLESGLVERYGHLFEEAWCCIIDDSDN